MMESDKFEQWALVELFGHQKIAGRVSEQTVGGASFIRIDVPEIDGTPGFTKFFGASAIYSITPCSEEAVKLAIGRLQVRPIEVWVVPNKPALPKPMDDDKLGW